MTGNANDAIAFFEGLSRRLLHILKSPSDSMPTVRCLSRTQLDKTLREIQADLRLEKGARLTAPKLREHLVRSGIVRPIPVQNPATGERTNRLYTHGIAGDHGPLHPVELLQATVRQGVVCYFTAIQFHKLSTQVPPHHHIAVPGQRASSAPNRRSKTASLRPPRLYDPLGTCEFVLDGVRYYRTSRDPDRMPGIERRFLNSQTLFRITTLEQTLLDTLHRPPSCGGSSVVLEAWDTARGDMDEERLAAYLAKIGDEPMTRRVGDMLEQLGHHPGADLGQMLAAARG